MITRDFLSPHTSFREISEKDLKQYRHLDNIIGLTEAQEVVSKIEAGERHQYLPLLRYYVKWRRPDRQIRVLENRKVRFRTEKRKPKSRPISYASHKDAIAYKYVREGLSPLFEKSLAEDGLSENILAYRRIPKGKGPGNKSNIDFAAEAFEAIKSLENCCVVAVDIKDYFGSIDHKLLKQRLLRLLDTHQLPRDLARAFKNVTQYRIIDLDDAYRALGFSEKIDGKLRFKQKKSKIPRKLCSTSDYRSKIVGTGLIKNNPQTHGIPQGTPISDIFANLFLRDVDLILKGYAENKGGFFFRYSDDILLILPGDGRAANKAEQFVSTCLRQHSPLLKLGADKTEISIFKNGISAYNLHPVKGSRRKARSSSNLGISYLGFRFDGHRTFLRNSTIANLRRKIVKRCYVIGANHVQRYQGKSKLWLLQNAPVHTTKELYLQMRMDKINQTRSADGTENSPEETTDPYEDKNFYSYVKTAEKRFKNMNPKFMSQLKKIPQFVEDTIIKAIKANCP